MELVPGHEMLRAAAARLAAAGLDEAAREARLLARAARDAAEFEAFVSRRAAREPFAYIVGHREFWSLDFEVSPAVLIPRPDSETLVEAALKVFSGAPPARIVDLGTGSGCLLVALLSEWRDACGVAVDISADALEIAQRNSVRHGVAARMSCLCCDFAAPLPGPFDLVVSNPPYIAEPDMAGLEPDVRDFEPGLALRGGRDGLDAYRRIADALPDLLGPGGKVLLEIGHDQAESAALTLRNKGLEILNVIKDLGGNDRVIVASRGA